MRSAMLGANIHLANQVQLSGAGGGGGTPLSPEPTVQATSLVISAVTSTTLTLAWTAGNGNKSIVVMKASGAVDSDPVDATTYTANAAFGSGDEIGTGNYVVYAGTGVTVDITGLTGGTTYHVAVYTYNDGDGAGTENYLGTPLTGSQETASAALILKVKTDNTGTSNDDQFTLPLRIDQTYDFTVKYDGQETTHNTDTSLTLTFPSGAGTYSIEITGTFPAVRFNNGGDRLKLLELENWGAVTWTTFERALFGCANMTITATDHATANTGNVTDFSRAWRESGITSFPLIDTSSATTFIYAYQDCTSLASFPLLDVSSVENMRDAFSGCTGLNGYAFPTLHLDSMTNGFEMFQDVTLDTEAWSDLLVYTEANNAITTCLWSGGNSPHNAAGTTAIAALAGRDPGWTITDGGAFDLVAIAEYDVDSAIDRLDVDWSTHDSTYDQFKVHLIGIDFSADGAALTVRGLFSGAPDTGTDYDEHLMKPDSSASTYAGDANASATSLLASSPTGNAAGENMSGVLTAYNPTNASLNKLFGLDGAGLDAAGDCIMAFNGAELENTGAMDGVRLAPSSGTFTGKVVLLGRVNV